MDKVDTDPKKLWLSEGSHTALGTGSKVPYVGLIMIINISECLTLSGLGHGLSRCHPLEFLQSYQVGTIIILLLQMRKSDTERLSNIPRFTQHK